MSVVIILVAAIIAIQTPEVQTKLAKKAIEAVSKKIDGDISIGKMHIDPFKAVVIKDIVIKDRNPWRDSVGHAPVDTFFQAEYITANFSIKSFLGGSISLSSAKVSNGQFNLVIEPYMDADTMTTRVNLKRIFKLGGSKNEKKRNDNEIFFIRNVALENMRFTMRNFNRDSNVIGADAINWYDMDVSDINVSGRRLRMKGGVMYGICDKMSFREKSGYICYHLSGNTSVGNGKTFIGDLRLIDGWSDITIPEFTLTYANTEAWSDFISKVRMKGEISRSTVSMSSLGFFAPALKNFRMTTEISGLMNGYVNDFRLKNIRFKTTDTDGFGTKSGANNGGISGEMNGSITGLPDSKAMLLSADVKKLTFTSHGLERFIKGWAPDVNLKLDNICKDKAITFSGRAKGPLNRLHATGKLHSKFGIVHADISLRNLLDSYRPLAIGGTIRTEELDISDIVTGIPVGKCNMRTGLNATIAKDSLGVRIDSLFVDKLNVLGYDYSGIAAAGTFAQDAFNGRIVCSDPNLSFLFQGIFSLSSKTQNALYQFYANLGYADLHALNIDKRGISRISFSTNANFTRVSGDDIIGNIDIDNMVLEDEHGIHDVGDIEIASHSGSDLNRIRFDSEFAEGSFVGSKFITSFIRDLKAVTTEKELPSLDVNRKSSFSSNSYNLSFKFHDTKDILSFFAPGAYIADSTALALNIGKDGLLNAHLRSRRLAIKDKYIKNIDLEVGNHSGRLDGTMKVDEISATPVLTKCNKLNFSVWSDSLKLGFSYDNDNGRGNRGKISVGGRLFRDADDSLNLSATILPSNISLNATDWKLHSGDMMFSKHSIKVNTLGITSPGQSIKVTGGYSSDTADTLRMDMNKFDISMINAFSNIDMGIKGLVSGKALLISPTGEKTGILMSVNCDSTEFGGEKLGTLRLASVWDEEKRAFNYICKNDLDGVQNLNAYGNFSPSTKYLEGRLNLNGLNVGYGMPFLNSIFSTMSGSVSGDIAFIGQINALGIASKDLRLNKVRIKVGFTNVEYVADGSVSLDSKGVRFLNVNVNDRFNEKGSISGGITWEHFRNMSFDTNIKFNRMEVLNTGETDNPVFYGTVFGTGSLDITGPLESLMLTASARTEKSGTLHIPLNSSSSANVSNLLTFKEPQQEIKIDPYEEMLKRLKSKEKKNSSFGVKLRINATPDVTASIDIDQATGNVLTGRGNGQIDLDVRPSTGTFNINGFYNILGGNYHLVALGIAKRDFTIQEGSSVKFNGDIMDSDLDINALYKTKASIGTLIADTTSTTRRVVECGISITDRLSNPRLAFSINVPDLDPTTQARVESALNSQDKIQKQLLALLLTNGFLPEEQSGVTNNSPLMYVNVTEIMANQLNNILQKLNIPVDLGLDYQQSTSGSNIFDVALSTALFNNRVLVNGTIGNRQYTSGATGSEVVGDLDIDVKLDKPGALRLNLFSHSADQYTNYLDNTQRNGIGLTYQKEFDNFMDFIRNLFRSRKKKREVDNIRKQDALNQKKITIHIEPCDEQKSRRGKKRKDE